MNKYGFLALVSILALVGITNWLKNITELPSQADNKPKKDKLEYYLKTFKITQFNEIGELTLLLSGNYLHYTPETDSTEIIKPNINYTSKNNATWQIRADKAIAKSEKLDEYQFSGNVTVKRLADHEKEFEKIAINTEELLFKPNAEYIETQRQTELVSGTNKITAENGLTANLHTGLMTLSLVEGLYKADAN